ncbi:Vascular endothelial growth factor receptor 1 [Hypsibius exemplaris]|uniref:Vascular endothelial growth factor receptor 1 n=1 Tax=Hypsibius exemplaris TaxID=2072580 RepID=A0A1W0W8C1_HYPEX|nr:Vascular endothelial growth factor receptor 1 [Hypsibius exemplaris]
MGAGVGLAISDGWVFVAVALCGAFPTIVATTAPESKEQKQQPWIVVGSSVGAIVVILMPILVCVCSRLTREKRRRQELVSLEELLNVDDGESVPLLIDQSIPVTEQVDRLRYDPHWEVPRDSIRLTGQVLGSGHFGIVRRGVVTNLHGQPGETVVAVKTLKNPKDALQRTSLVNEIKIMSYIGQHLNVVNLLGAVTQNIARVGDIFMLTEYCQNGSLLSHLEQCRDNFFGEVKEDSGELYPCGEEREIALRLHRQRRCIIEATEIVTTRDLFYYAFQISKGMFYLNNRNVLHRDLAARNVLVAANHVVKICDFGLARQDYIYKRDVTRRAAVPMKWLAIESLTEGVYSKESDVWSFGVLLWEMFTLGGEPYPGFPTEQHPFMGALKAGRRMERPPQAPQEIYSIMRHCWEDNPRFRPSFDSISEELLGFLESNLQQQYLNLSAPYERFNLTHDSGYLNDPMPEQRLQMNESLEQLSHIAEETLQQSVLTMHDERSVQKIEAARAAALCHSLNSSLLAVNEHYFSETSF